ncbi:MAG TPA: hypothetical protein VFB81_14675, partial [Myxococcales bacterium]|nr:hypothetical protein [Myxococcales bacterium]
LARQRRLAAACDALREVREDSRRREDEAKLASACHELALLCQRSALHAEALWYLQEAIDARFKLYRPLKRSQRIRHMAQTRLDELKDLAHELIEEAGRVARVDSERRALLRIVERVEGRPGNGSSLKARWDSLMRTRARPDERLWEWQETLRRDADARWREELLPGAFEKLGEQTRRELVLAEVVYHGAIDDLARSTHLLALAVERELRERVLIPLRRWYPESSRPSSLGRCLELVEELSAPAARPGREQLHERAAPAREGLATVARLRRKISPLDGSQGFSLVEIRNRVAHGDDGGSPLGRLAVDAVKRTLVLEAPAILQALAEIDLRA